jgi:hypothetical protein
MDAWASVSHLLAYKGEASVPSHLRRDFNALSGLFYVADQHFEIFANAAGEVERVTEESLAKDGTEEGAEISLDSMFALLNSIFPGRDIEREDVGYITERLLRKSYYRSINDVKTALLEARPAALAFEAYIFKGEQQTTETIANITFSIADKRYRDDNLMDDEVKELTEWLDKYRKKLKSQPRGDSNEAKN